MSTLSQLTPSPITSKINLSVNCAANDRTFFGKNSTATQLSFRQLSTNAFKSRQHSFWSKSSQPCRFDIDYNGNKNRGETVKLHRNQCPRSASSSRQLCSKATVNGSGAAFIADGGSVSPGAPILGGLSLPDDISTSEADNGTLSGAEVPASDPGAWPVQSGLGYIFL